MPLLAKYRFQPGIAGSIVALAGTAFFVALSVWQIGRADEKRALQALVDARMAEPPLQYTGQAIDLEASQYRQATMRGRFLEEAQLLIDNVVMNGKPGYRVITLFAVEGDGHVLVDRGWVPQGRLRHVLPETPVPVGMQSIAGRLDRHRSRPVVGAERADPEGNRRWLYVDTARYREYAGLQVPDFVVHLAPGSEAAYATEAAAFDAKVGMHIGYAIQWGAFALIAALTWLGLSFRRREQ